MTYDFVNNSRVTVADLEYGDKKFILVKGPFSGKVKTVSIGLGFYAVITTDNKLYMIGKNNNGQYVTEQRCQKKNIYI